MTGHLQRFLAELQRRKVLRIAAAYVVGAWIVLQVALALQTAMSLSGQFSATMLAILVIGFFVTLVLAWFYEITPEGVKRTAPAAGDAPLVKPQITDFALAGALALVVVVILVQLLTSSPTAPPAIPAPTTTAEATPAKPEPPRLGDKSIAVLPFANLSPDKEDAYIADGLTEELLNLLAKSPELKVISRTSSFAFKGKNTPLPDVAKTLGVRHILEGSVREQGNRLRVTAQLIDVVTDTHLWSETYDRTIDDVFALQDDIARAIAAALSIEVMVATAGSVVPTRSIDAYRAFLEGRELVRLRTPAPLERSIALLSRAITLDPAFAEAHAELASSYYAQLDARPEYEALARKTAKDALAHRATLATPHAVLCALDRALLAWESAVASCRRAVALEPNNSTARGEFGVTELAIGNIDVAANAMIAARQVDPYYEQAHFVAIAGEIARGNMLAAEELAESMSASQTQYRRLAHLVLTTLAYDRQDGSKAEAHFRSVLLESARNLPFVEPVARALRTRSGIDAAVRALESRIPESPSPLALEFVLWTIADRDKILAHATMLLQSRKPSLVTFVAVSVWQPRYKSMRAHRGFRALLRNAGLVDYWKKHGWPDRCRPKGEDDFECS